PPKITQQPQSQTVLAGGDALFSVTAAGTYPLAYQWRFKGTNIATATGASYLRATVQPSDTGGYDVVVNNSAGSKTSAVASLNLVNRPILLGPRIGTNGNFSFTLSGSTGYPYLIEASTNLSNWVAVGTITNLTGQASFTTTNAGSYWQRVFRAKLLP